jgi:hypothetical protein
MQTQFVRVLCDVHCKWEGSPPRYRAFVNDELFTERTWIWDDVYLEEAFQIQAVPGKYTLRYELVDPDSAQLKIKNMRIDTGNAEIHKGTLEIHYEST